MQAYIYYIFLTHYWGSNNDINTDVYFTPSW